MQPKVFISYSWTTTQHQLLVKEWADRLMADGIDVVLDIYDLKEGHDKFVFMEKMITDPQVTHVLIIADKTYSEKADARKSGVGTESQIISSEVYSKVEQTKFIPIVCDFSEDKSPYLPIFLKSRMWIDFSSPEKTNENWEQLVRVIYGKPLHQKPKLGTPPVYITSNTSAPSSPAIAKFSTLKQALLQNKTGIPLYRDDFLKACIEYADAIRVRERPDVESTAKKIIEDYCKLKLVRDHIIDWIFLESAISKDADFNQILIDFLEKLRELKSRPENLNAWNESWFAAHAIFVYETFLYIIAALIKTHSYKTLHEIFTSHYLIPIADRYKSNEPFDTFDCFYTSAGTDELHSELDPSNQKLYSPIAELIKRHSDREDIVFKNIIEAELLVLLMALIKPDGYKCWYPQTFHYAGYSEDFPFFIRATQHKNFENLADITGIQNADVLRNTVKEGIEKYGIKKWHNFSFRTSFWESMNMDKLDLLK